MKKIISLVLSVALVMSMGITAFATNDISDSAERGFCIVESEESRNRVGRARSTYDWEVLDSKWASTSLGAHFLTSYILWTLSDTRYAKAETKHYDNNGDMALLGYSRARFESLFGIVISGSDSDRVWGYGTSVAETPKDVAGGVAHAYCGDESV